jgi:hypothetical protein
MVFLKEFKGTVLNKSAMKDRESVYEAHVGLAHGVSSPVHSAPREGKSAKVCSLTYEN